MLVWNISAIVLILKGNILITSQSAKMPGLYRNLIKNRTNNNNTFGSGKGRFREGLVGPSWLITRALVLTED
jgi:hypothetical protein